MIYTVYISGESWISKLKTHPFYRKFPTMHAYHTGRPTRTLASSLSCVCAWPDRTLRYGKLFLFGSAAGTRSFSGGDDIYRLAVCGTNYMEL